MKYQYIVQLCETVILSDVVWESLLREFSKFPWMPLLTREVKIFLLAS